MAVSSKIEGFIERASWIRKMFEEGARLKQVHGPENVFDFSLGNPNVEPVPALKQAMVNAAQDNTPGIHGYMPNAGYPDVRAAVARKIHEDEGVDIDENWIVMTVGAGGGLNVILKTILNPEDEVICPKPHFVEYLFYIDNHGGKAVQVPTQSDFSLDLGEIESAINPKTAAVLINSPNNPTGRVFPSDQIKGLSELLTKKSSEIGRPIALISDEPYRGIIYDNVEVPSILAAYQNAAVVTSFSKDLSIPGERMGYIALNPQFDKAQTVMEGLVLCNRILGFGRAMQVLEPEALRESVLDYAMQIVSVYGS